MMINLKTTVTLINWLTGFMGQHFEDPYKIDNFIIKEKEEYITKSWEKVRSTIFWLYKQQGLKTVRLRNFVKLSEAVLFSFVVLFILSLFIQIPVVFLIIFSPFSLIVYIAFILLRAYSKQKIKNKMKEIRIESNKEIQKITDVIQDLIFYLCDQILLSHEDPKKHKMKIINTAFHGVTIVGKPGFLGSDYYTAVPSVLGKILSSSMGHFKIVDLWAHENETYQALFKSNPKTSIDLIVPEEIGKNEKHHKAWEKIKQKQRKLKVSFIDVKEIENRIIITDKSAWVTESKGWHTIKKVTAKKRKILEGDFDKKWKRSIKIV